jgi:hypothetical protein
LYRLCSLLLGFPLPTAGLGFEKLSKFKSLATFAPDPLSSIAYANQEIYLGLAMAGAAGPGYTFTLGEVITVIPAIAAFSYLQIIHEYSAGGGSYIVAKETWARVLGRGYGPPN